MGGCQLLDGDGGGDGDGDGVKLTRTMSGGSDGRQTLNKLLHLTSITEKRGVAARNSVSALRAVKPCQTMSKGGLTSEIGRCYPQKATYSGGFSAVKPVKPDPLLLIVTSVFARQYL